MFSLFKVVLHQCALSHQGALSSGWYFIRVLPLISVVLHQGGISPRCSLSHQSGISPGCSLSSGWHFIRVLSHQCGISLWSHFTRVLSLIKVAFHQGALCHRGGVSSGCCISSGCSLIRVVFHWGALSSGISLYIDIHIC